MPRSIKKVENPKGASDEEKIIVITESHDQRVPLSFLKQDFELAKLDAKLADDRVKLAKERLDEAEAALKNA